MLRVQVEPQSKIHVPPFKPKMRHVSTFDCGWRYEWWMCHGHGFKAFGKTQEEAYRSWVNGWNLGYVWG